MNDMKATAPIIPRVRKGRKKAKGIAIASNNIE